MNDANGNKRLQVLAVIEREDKPTIWRQVGVAFPNRDAMVYPLQAVTWAKRGR